jgi:hypothetical protein
MTVHGLGAGVNLKSLRSFAWLLTFSSADPQHTSRYVGNGPHE